MNFKDGENYYRNLKSQLNNNNITYEEFRKEVEKICFQTNDNTWWRIREQDGAWLWWDGKQWIEYRQESNINPNKINQSQNNKSRNTTSVELNSNERRNSKNVQQNMRCFKEKLPKTFLELLIYIIKKLPGTLGKNLPMAVGVGLITWILHTILLVGPNEGFNPGSNNNLAQILALKDNKIAGSLFWFVASMGMTMILKQVLGGNIKNLTAQVITTPKYILNLVKKGGNKEKIIISLSCAVVLFLSIRFGNKYLNLATGSVFFLALQNWKRNFLFVMFKFIWSDIQRWFFNNKKLPINHNFGVSAYSGITLGFFVAGLIGDYRIIANIIVIGLVGFVVYLINNKNKKPTLTMLMTICGTIILYFFSTEYIVFADDGGYQEAGGTFSSWITSQGALIAIIMGLFPGLVAILSSLLSNLGIDMTSLFPEDFNSDESEEENQDEKKVWIEILANPNGIKADGVEISWIYAKVCTSDPKINAEELTFDISFDVSGKYSYLLSVGQPQYTSGYKVVNVSANINQNESYPSTASVNIIASVNSPEGVVSKSTTVTLELPGEIKLQMTTNPEKKSLLPDGKKGIWVYARPVLSGKNDIDMKALDEILNNIEFSSGGEGADWTDLSEPNYVDNWKCIFVKASNPDKSNGGNSVSKSFSIIANAIVGEKDITESVTIELLPMPKPQIKLFGSKFNILGKSSDKLEIKYELLDFTMEPEITLDVQSSFLSLEVSKNSLNEDIIEVSTTQEAYDKPFVNFIHSIKCTMIAENDMEKVEKQFNVNLCYEGIGTAYTNCSNNKTPDKMLIKCFTDSEDEKRKEQAYRIPITVMKWDDSLKELKPDDASTNNLTFEFNANTRSRKIQVQQAVEVVEEANIVAEIENGPSPIRTMDNTKNPAIYMIYPTKSAVAPAESVDIFTQISSDDFDESLNLEAELKTQNDFRAMLKWFISYPEGTLAGQYIRLGSYDIFSGALDFIENRVYSISTVPFTPKTMENHYEDGIADVARPKAVVLRDDSMPTQIGEFKKIQSLYHELIHAIEDQNGDMGVFYNGGEPERHSYYLQYLSDAAKALADLEKSSLLQMESNIRTAISKFYDVFFNPNNATPQTFSWFDAHTSTQHRIFDYYANFSVYSNNTTMTEEQKNAIERITRKFYFPGNAKGSFVETDGFFKDAVWTFAWNNGELFNLRLTHPSFKFNEYSQRQWRTGNQLVIKATYDVERLSDGKTDMLNVELDAGTYDMDNLTYPKISQFKVKWSATYKISDCIMGKPINETYAVRK